MTSDQIQKQKSAVFKRLLDLYERKKNGSATAAELKEFESLRAKNDRLRKLYLAAVTREDAALPPLSPEERRKLEAEKERLDREFDQIIRAGQASGRQEATKAEAARLNAILARTDKISRHLNARQK